MKFITFHHYMGTRPAVLLLSNQITKIKKNKFGVDVFYSHRSSILVGNETPKSIMKKIRNPQDCNWEIGIDMQE